MIIKQHQSVSNPQASARFGAVVGFPADDTEPTNSLVDNIIQPTDYETLITYITESDLTCAAASVKFT